MDKNKEAYENESIYPAYFGKPWLLNAEKKFIRLFSKKISSFEMLDVGIGGGRTTFFFAPKVRNYVGIDYSTKMVGYCQEKFVTFRHVEFAEMDARDLSTFSTERFDLILFSFNGIDCVDYNGRKRILLEFNRVLKTGGLLLFSFHNVRHVYRLYSFQMPRNPFKIPREVTRTRKLREINGGTAPYAGRELFTIYDGADHFQTLILYLLPERQREDLLNAGFEPEQWQDLQSGKTLSRHQLVHTTNPWIFVRARKL